MSVENITKHKLISVKYQGRNPDPWSVNLGCASGIREDSISHKFLGQRTEYTFLLASKK